MRSDMDLRDCIREAMCDLPDTEKMIVLSVMIDTLMDRVSELRKEVRFKLVHDNNMTKTDYINVSSLVRQPLDYAVEQGIIDENLLRRVKLEPRMFKPVRKKSSETQVFTKEELAKLKQIAWDDLDKPHPFELRLTPLAFLFMFQTGLRIGEVCAVRFGDIEGGELHLQRTVERDTKNIKDGLKGDNTERWVMLSNEARHIIDEAKARQIAAGVYDEG